MPNDETVPEQIMKSVEEMYTGATTRVRTECGVSVEFPVPVGLHQGSALNPSLLKVVLDVVKSVRKEELWELLYADDLGILTKSAYVNVCIWR